MTATLPQFLLPVPPYGIRRQFQTPHATDPDSSSQASSLARAQSSTSAVIALRGPRPTQNKTRRTEDTDKQLPESAVASGNPSSPPDPRAKGGDGRARGWDGRAAGLATWSRSLTGGVGLGVGLGQAGIGEFSAGRFATVAWVRERGKGGLRLFPRWEVASGWSGSDVLDSGTVGGRGQTLLLSLVSRS